jgi:signal transduction histidine kinase
LAKVCGVLGKAAGKTRIPPATQLISRESAAGVKVHREILSDTVTVLSTPGELRQVLANIIGNATDAMRQGGCLRIRISNRKQVQRTGCCVRLTIADNGTGIPPDVLPSIFEPFVTTKGETGTGLGLRVTSEIVKKNGWKIHVRSSRNPARRGTVFSRLIPKLASA